MLGEFVLPNGGAVWTSTVVDGLAQVGIEERNARQALARLGDDGIVRAAREGRRARWHLTERGAEILAGGTRRIYGFGTRADDWDGSWVVVTCAIPETDRSKRVRLRTRLGFEGFGFLAPTIAVSPHLDSEAAAGRILAELGLADQATTFVAVSGSMTPDERIVAEAWDLADLAEAYAEFVADFGSAGTERADPRLPEPEFGRIVLLVEAWRRFPSLDPELPSRLLPSDWPGVDARSVFDARRAAWSANAQRWFADAESSA